MYIYKDTWQHEADCTSVQARQTNHPHCTFSLCYVLYVNTRTYTYIQLYSHKHTHTCINEANIYIYIYIGMTQCYVRDLSQERTPKCPILAIV